MNVIQFNEQQTAALAAALRAASCPQTAEKEGSARGSSDDEGFQRSGEGSKAAMERAVFCINYDIQDLKQGGSQQFVIKDEKSDGSLVSGKFCIDESRRHLNSLKRTPIVTEIVELSDSDSNSEGIIERHDSDCEIVGWLEDNSSEKPSGAKKQKETTEEPTNIISEEDLSYVPGDFLITDDDIQKYSLSVNGKDVLNGVTIERFPESNFYIRQRSNSEHNDSIVGILEEKESTEAIENEDSAEKFPLALNNEFNIINVETTSFPISNFINIDDIPSTSKGIVSELDFKQQNLGPLTSSTCDLVPQHLNTIFNENDDIRTMELLSSTCENISTSDSGIVCLLNEDTENSKDQEDLQVLKAPIVTNIDLRDQDSEDTLSLDDNDEQIKAENTKLILPPTFLSNYEDIPSTSTGIVSHLNLEDQRAILQLSSLDRNQANTESDLRITSSEDEFDEPMDEEEEKKFIELIESDDENEFISIRDNLPPDLKTKEDNTDNLIHYFCPICNIACGIMKRWRTHLEMYHQLRTITNLKFQTIINKNGAFRYKCQVCDKQLKTSVIFAVALSHCIQHLEFPDYIMCRICKARFRDRSKFRLHLKRHHSKLRDNYINRNYTPYIKCVCPICKVPQQNRDAWKTHLILKHKYMEDLSDRYRIMSDRFKCKECHKIFKKNAVFAHSLSHEQKHSFECEVCQAYSNHSFATTLNHVRSKHYGLKKVKTNCSRCDKKFPTVAQRNQHIKEVHNYEPLQCEICKLQFTTASSLFTHKHLTNHQKLK